MSTPTQQLSVPTEAVLDMVAGQRNQALDENAQLRAYLGQVLADNERLQAEVDKLRADA